MRRSQDVLNGIRRVVVKVGTSTLAHASGELNMVQIEQLVGELSGLRDKGFEVALVTSGAIAAGMGRMGVQERPKTMPEKQAMAAIGQGILMHVYENLFGERGHIVGQVLLTKDDVMHRERYLNARNTLLTLLRFGAVPIINENDTVVVEEIRFGENDTLSALVAGLIDADLLVLLSDIDGLYTADPKTDKNACFVQVVEEITPEIASLAGKTGSKLACGGMATKINAAKIACSFGIPMIITNGAQRGRLKDIAAGINPGTLFLPRENRIHSRKGWIAFGSKSSGMLYVDSGAEKAIAAKGKSLLPSGITRVEGSFRRGYVVSIIGNNGEIARGIVNYNSEEIEKIKGCQSKDIAGILGTKYEDEVIHRDNLSLMV